MTGEPAGRTAAYDYELPDHLIAARPAERRDGSRLLILDRTRGGIRHASFPDLAGLVSEGDAIVVNDSRVFPARILGAKPTGARAEILLIRPEIADGQEPAEPGHPGKPGDEGDPAVRIDAEPESGAGRRTDVFADPAPRRWRAMVRPGGKLKPGRSVEIAAGFEIEILDSHPDGTRTVRLHCDDDPWSTIERHGHMPLPPYIDRPDDEADRARYQTVYAEPIGSVAAPTAGLHFTPDLLTALEDRGVVVSRITLHVGFGTFRPVSAERIDEHVVSPEWFRVEAETAARLNSVRGSGGRVWAIGTTTCRVLESIVVDDEYRAGTGWTDLFIRPPHEFIGIDGLVTNFHLPRSSLLMLVAAFAGRERTLETYATAVREGYRFYSYGDAMAIS
ncbi:MAG: tRNA preQ1(34) S-adenosylmethionine ribosyltransferase-isomerase QueA [Gemmatimonadetes bacterium]|nr:tRNA preQ1(34) S-adenosylmethionine ribosyltransferase-isomerase QueA [Gemmatimonadota bacterium]